MSDQPASRASRGEAGGGQICGIHGSMSLPKAIFRPAPLAGGEQWTGVSPIGYIYWALFRSSGQKVCIQSSHRETTGFGQRESWRGHRALFPVHCVGTLTTESSKINISIVEIQLTIKNHTGTFCHHGHPDSDMGTLIRLHAVSQLPVR